MMKILLSIGILIAASLSTTLQAAPGEWWEITAKMEMEGMPFAMPSQTTKVCMPKGGERDPKYSQGSDSNCKMTDVKQTGNKVKFKGTCVNDGETMNVAGESSHDGNSFKSSMKMTGKSDGETVNMTTVSSGKRIGGSCDTEAMGKKAKATMDAGMAAACDTSKYKTTDWVASSSLFIGGRPSCPGKQDAMCKVLRNEVPRDVQAFQLLEQQEQSRDTPSAAKACKLNMAGIKKSLCKAKAKSGPLSFLEASCPAEAKAYRELQRKRAECEGRGFTGVNSAKQMKSCMGGVMLEEESPAKTGKAKADSEDEEAGSSKSDAMLEGAKKLKGMFGF